MVKCYVKYRQVSLYFLPLPIKRPARRLSLSVRFFPFRELTTYTYMTKNAAKEEKERGIFQYFLTRQSWPNDSRLVNSGKPPQPDILYDHPHKGKIAFELCEICDPIIARQIVNIKPDEMIFIRSNENGLRALESKLAKSYLRDCPVGLLLYTNGRVILPDEVIKEELMWLLDKREVAFNHIWLMGDNIHCIYGCIGL